MQRRHFKAIADALNAVRPAADNTPEYYMWARTVSRMADMCRLQNPRFDQDRFLNACGAREVA
jgi:hypothetical protein